VSSLHKVRIIRVRSNMSGLHLVQTHGASSESQVRWVQPETVQLRGILHLLFSWQKFKACTKFIVHIQCKMVWVIIFCGIFQ
jgi:hypothetical protein